MTPEEEERFVKIESSLAHMEQLTETLNKTIIVQDKTIRRLTQQVEQMNDAIQAKEMDTIKGNVTKPPHYQ